LPRNGAVFAHAAKDGAAILPLRNLNRQHLLDHKMHI
jgi:hypothetical protein